MKSKNVDSQSLLWILEPLCCSLCGVNIKCSSNEIFGIVVAVIALMEAGVLHWTDIPLCIFMSVRSGATAAQICG